MQSMTSYEINPRGQEITPTTDLEVLKGELKAILKQEGRLYRSNFDQTYRFNGRGRTLAEYESPQLADRVLAVHKLLFLTGGVERDVVIARDPWENYIYTKLYSDPINQNIDPNSADFRKKNPYKAGEVDEVRGAVSLFIGKVEAQAKDSHVGYEEVDLRLFLNDPLHDLPEVLSEIADIVYNMQNVDSLDTDYNYEGSIREIADDLGYSFSQALYLAYLKYDLRVRQNGKKKILEENMKIREEILGDRLPIPDLGQLSVALGTINRIDSNIISTRLRQLPDEIGRALKSYLI